MYEKPKSRSENARLTQDFTERLSVFAKQLGCNVPEVFESGNATEGDAAYIFEANVNGLTFNVEVFGPYWEEEA